VARADVEPGGWFLWTLLVALGVAGPLYGATKSFRLLAPWPAVVAIELFFIGSLNGWHGTDSFGSRLMMSTLPNCCPWVIHAPFGGVAGRAGYTDGRGHPLLRVQRSICGAVPAGSDSLGSDAVTADEIFANKMHLMRMRNQKRAVSNAARLLAADDFRSAIPILEAAAAEGDDRDVQKALARAYRAKGDISRLEEIEQRRKRYLDTRLS
jgi:hypothetical protein